MWPVRLTYRHTSYSRFTSVMTSGFSWPSTRSRERAVEVVDVHDDRFRAERAEEVVEHPPGGDPHAVAGEVGRAADRPVDRDDVAEAVLEHAVAEAVDALRGHLVAEVVAERALHDVMDLGVVLERERQPLDLGDRHDLADDAAHQRHELELARDEHRERRRVGAGHVAVPRMHRHLQLAAGLGGDVVPQRREEAVGVALLGLVVELAAGPARADGGR